MRCSTQSSYALLKSNSSRCLLHRRAINGLPQEWVDRLEAHHSLHQCLSVRRTLANTDAAAHLQEGDLLLAIDGEAVTRFRHVEIASQYKETVRLTMWRDGVEKQIDIRTVPLVGQETNSFALWAGAFLQDSYRAIRLQQKDVPKGVYCSRYFFGSPAEFYDLKAKVWILQINDKMIESLKEFIDVASNLPDNEFVRLKTIDTKNNVRVLTLRTNNHYWPATKFDFDEIERRWIVCC